MKTLKLQRKTFFLLVFASLVPLLITIFVATTGIQRNVEENLLLNLQQQSEENTNHINDIMKERIGDIVVLADNVAVTTNKSDNTTLLKKLNIVQQTYESYKDISIVREDGSILLSTTGKTQPYPVDSDWFVKAKEGSVGISDVQVNDGSEFIIDFVIEVKENEGMHQYVVTEYNFEEIIKLVRQTDTSQQKHITILDSENTVIAHRNSSMLLKKIDFPYNTCSSGSREYKAASGERYLIGYAPAAKGILNDKNKCWLIILLVDEENVNIATTFLVQILSLGIITIILTLLLSKYASERLSRPLLSLTAQARELSKGNFLAKTNIKTGDEIEELSNTLNTTSDDLANLDKERKQVDDAKTQFLSISSHELRSPMTPMKAQLQMLQSDYFGKLTNRQKEAIDIILRNTNRLDTIINDLLEMSRIEAARLQFKFIKTDLSNQIKRLIEEMEGYLPEKKIKIVIDMKEIPIIEVDPDRVMQVLRNLINNAKKFSPAKTTITVSVEPQKNGILFSVKDQGIGIPKACEQKVFEPFFQAEQTIYRQYGGTGLGLVICKGIVESQGGKIWFDSIEGKGTTFYFTIPLLPLKEIRPIRNLFGGHQELENKIRNIFLTHLGPIGESEFKAMEKIGLQYDVMTNYLDSLKKEGIVGEDTYEKMKSDLKKALKIEEQEIGKETADIEKEIIKAFMRKQDPTEKANREFIKENHDEKRGQHKK